MAYVLTAAGAALAGGLELLGAMAIVLAGAGPGGGRGALLGARSSSYAEFLEEQEALEAVPLPPEGRPDWAGRTIAFKGVLLEGVEVILIVTALGARPGGLAPALVGSGFAAVACVAIGVVLHRPL